MWGGGVPDRTMDSIREDREVNMPYNRSRLRTLSLTLKMAKDYEAFFENVGLDEDERQITLDYMKELFSLIISELKSNANNDKL